MEEISETKNYQRLMDGLLEERSETKKLFIETKGEKN